MNNPNPFDLQGSRQERVNQARKSLRLAVFVTLGMATISLTVLLMQGCQKPGETPPTTLPPDTNVVVPTFTNPAPTTIATGQPPVLPPTDLIAPPPTNPPPAPPVAEGAKQHTVEPGDSFYTLAKKYGVTQKAVELANPGVDSRKLKIGQKLNIPAPAPPAATTPAPEAGVPPATAETVYVVKSGDTLIRIARKTGTTAKAIRTANNLKTDRITVGQKLKIPAKAASAVTPSTVVAPPVVEPAPATSAPPTTPPSGGPVR